MPRRQAIRRHSGAHIGNHGTDWRQQRWVMVKGRQEHRARPLMAFIAGQIALPKASFQHGARHAAPAFRLSGDASGEFLSDESGKPAE